MKIFGDGCDKTQRGLGGEAWVLAMGLTKNACGAWKTIAVAWQAEHSKVTPLRLRTQRAFYQQARERSSNIVPRPFF